MARPSKIIVRNIKNGTIQNLIFKFCLIPLDTELHETAT